MLMLLMPLKHGAACLRDVAVAIAAGLLLQKIRQPETVSEVVSRLVVAVVAVVVIVAFAAVLVVEVDIAIVAVVVVVAAVVVMAV